MQVLHIVAVRRYQGTASGQGPNFLKDSSLRGRVDRDGPGPAALGPARFQPNMAVLDGVSRTELDRLLASQPECGLQPDAEADIGIRDPGKVRLLHRFCFGVLGDVIPPTDAVGAVVPSNDTRLVHLPRPPAKHGQAILLRTNANALVLPVSDQGIDMLRFQRFRLHAPVAQRLQLIGDPIQYS